MCNGCIRQCGCRMVEQIENVKKALAEDGVKASRVRMNQETYETIADKLTVAGLDVIVDPLIPDGEAIVR